MTTLASSPSAVVRDVVESTRASILLREFEGLLDMSRVDAKVVGGAEVSVAVYAEGWRKVLPPFPAVTLITHAHLRESWFLSAAAAATARP